MKSYYLLYFMSRLVLLPAPRCDCFSLWRGNFCIESSLFLQIVLFLCMIDTVGCVHYIHKGYTVYLSMV